MSKLICSCVDELFNKYDYNNIPIKKYLLKQHNNKENAWITIDKTVYSIRKDDNLLLELFKNYYGKDVKNFINDNKLFPALKEKVQILDKLKNRKIGFLIE
jgi:hypothetical protein